jgi:hypothetical protein
VTFHGGDPPRPISSPAKENRQMSSTATSRRTAALKTGLAALLALATTLIAWRPDWIEAFGLGDPDGGSGMVEAVIVAALGAAAIVTATWAWRGWVRVMTTNA